MVNLKMLLCGIVSSFDNTHNSHLLSRKIYGIVFRSSTHVYDDEFKDTHNKFP